MGFIDRINEAINMLDESAGSNGLRRRIEIEREKTILNQQIMKLVKLKKLKQKLVQNINYLRWIKEYLH
jgi:hypothetical protein